MDSPRGYAANSFRGAYDRMLSWSWAAALNANGELPTKSDYVYDCFHVYDRLAATRDDTRTIVKEVIDNQYQILYTSMAGSYVSRGPRGSSRVVKPADVSIDDVEWMDTTGGDDAEYRNIEHDESMQDLLVMLSDEDYAILEGYVSGTYDTLRASAYGNGMSKFRFNGFKERLRYAGLEGHTYNE